MKVKDINKFAKCFTLHYYINLPDPQEKSNKSLLVSEILLTFAPYTVGDENKEYQPTFIVRVKGINLIVECEDFDSDKSGNKETKRHYLKDYWIPTANNLKTYGTWQLLEIRDIDQLESEILKAITK